MMDNDVNQRRVAVFHIIYLYTLDLYSRWVTRPLRWTCEALLLLAALATLCVWGYVHYTYILSPQDCLGHLSPRPLPRDSILQVEVFYNTSFLWERRELALQELSLPVPAPAVTTPPQPPTSGGYCNSSLLELLGLRGVCEALGRTLCWLADEWLDISYDHLPHEDSGEEDLRNISEVNVTADGSISPQDISHDTHMHNVTGTTEVDTDTITLYHLFDFYTLKLIAFDYSLLEFTREPGFLSLTPSARRRLNITVLKLYVDPANTSCFGGTFGSHLTHYFLGYDMMIIASFKNLLPDREGSGFVKDLLTGGHYYYKVQWMGKWRYLAGLLPAMFFTLVASVLLRQIHYHIFKFLTHFRNLLQQGIPMPVQTGAQIPFLIVTYAAIGLIIVMSEALSDDSMFSVLMVATVWEVDQFYAIYCRQQNSKLYFPWFFFLYHFLPYAYFVRFNGQFWFLPFLFHWLMTQHAMLFFINHCELPGQRPQLRLVRAHHQQLMRLQLRLRPHPLLAARLPPPVPPIVREFADEAVGVEQGDPRGPPELVTGNTARLPFTATRAGPPDQQAGASGEGSLSRVSIRATQEPTDH